MKSVVVGTAGHIDHGKSALVLALTGTDPDRLKEEKARGITIDLGFAHVTLSGINFAFVDVPGHERFVKNMLAGVGGIDLVVLVVAADESIMPQTREHFDICRLLTIPTGLVAITKADLADEETVELVRLEVRDLLAGSLLAHAPIVPVSALTGAGLSEIRAALVHAASGTSHRSIQGPARLPIDRVFSMKGFGTVVTGTVASGRIAVEDRLLAAPGSTPVAVRGVQVHGERRDHAVAGERAAVNLSGVEADELRRGQSLVASGGFTETREVDVVLDVLPSSKPIKQGTRVRFHQGTAEIMGRVALIGAVDEEDASTGAGRDLLMPAARGYARVRLEEAAMLVRGDRFIVRAYSPPRTIAGGSVLDPAPPRIGTRSRAALARCQVLNIGPAGGLVNEEWRVALHLAEEAGDLGLPAASLVRRAGFEPGAARACLDFLIDKQLGLLVKDVFVAQRNIDRLRNGIMSALTEHHRAYPLSEGLAREEARVRLFPRGRAEVFEQVVETLIRAGKVTGHERLALAAHQIKVPSHLDQARRKIERLFLDAALRPPDARAAATESGVPPAVAEEAVRLLVREKILVRVEGLLFHEQALRRLKEHVTAMKNAAREPIAIDVGLFKERFGVTRKFAIPLLEYLDRERVTRRAGETRVIL
jgi:selenocysteine-specific elongation factor